MSETERVTREPDAAIVVQNDDQQWLIATSYTQDRDRRTYRYPISTDEGDQLLTGFDLSQKSDAIEVPQEWLALFPEGGEIGPGGFGIKNFGAAGPGRAGSQGRRLHRRRQRPGRHGLRRRRAAARRLLAGRAPEPHLRRRRARRDRGRPAAALRAVDVRRLAVARPRAPAADLAAVRAARRRRRAHPLRLAGRSTRTASRPRPRPAPRTRSRPTSGGSRSTAATARS